MSSKLQVGIVAELPRHGRYLTYRVRDLAYVKSCLQALKELVDGEQIVLGIGHSLVNALQQSIPGLKLYPSYTNTSIDLPATPAALWCWIRDDEQGQLHHIQLALQQRLSPAFELISFVDGFKYKSGLDLTGYEDGTENPEPEAIPHVVAAPQNTPGLQQGSFVVVQQWVHDFSKVQQMTEPEMDHVVGRRLQDNVELDDAPLCAHVKRTAQESFSPQAFMLRRSMPWSNESGAGLMFVAFAASFYSFEVQMQKMLGLQDGILDGLFRFSHPVSGAYFWCPPMDANAGLDLSALGL